MVRPELRSIGTIQIDDIVSGPNETFSPIDPQHFGILIDAYIGPKDGQGMELFQFTVCSPSWMNNEVVTGSAHWLRFFLLLEHWNYDAVKNAVSKLCSSIEELDWNSVGNQLGKYMRWEFEDA